jgi:hypothetical protein
VDKRERRLPQPGTDPFGTGVDAVRSCSHVGSVNHFVDN